MITYQVKVTIQKEVETEWLHWMKTKHVPDVIATGLVQSFQILKPDDEAQTYMFHYHFGNRNAYETYRSDYAPLLKAHPQELFPDKFSASRAIFEWI